MFEFLKRKNADPKVAIRKVLGEYTLPSFSGTIMTVLKSLRDPSSSGSKIAETLSMDPGLTMQVLRIANSPIFSPSSKIQNLPQAIALVGMSQLESLVLSVAVKDSFPKGSPFFNYGRFWQISIKRGFISKELATILCPTKTSECFTAGFLQDMALPFLAQNRPEEYRPVLEQWYGEYCDLSELERDRFSWDHAEVATWICSEWDFPESIAYAIGSHHSAQVDLNNTFPPVNLVSLLVEYEEKDGTDQLIETANAQYGIPTDRILELIQSGVKVSTDLSGMMS